ncbi:hypothetical protein [Blastococcus sp. TF02A-30]|uniref:hypothetical protein n=1 Tax=Blastococcus sp. TF02A-30 TaxID=2250580 RepID=UPI000DE94A7F|nr:hypothetical protein [Blastococcus sp. TF02A-30]RBY92843.1 hypothetical protein DQ241_01975 [Blastococcus sp. TF02A-30]
MAHRRALVAVSAVQLAAGLGGQVVALRRRRAYDTPFMGGSPDAVGRDSLVLGTALSAPVTMLIAQAWGTARLAGGPDERARAVLLALSTVMVPGYLLERLCRARLTPGGADAVETPLVATGLAGAVAMALLARPGQPAAVRP